MDSGVEALTAEIIRSITEDELRYGQGMVQAMRSGQPDEINKYDDLLLTTNAK